MEKKGGFTANIQFKTRVIEISINVALRTMESKICICTEEMIFNDL